MNTLYPLPSNSPRRRTFVTALAAIAGIIALAPMSARAASSPSPTPRVSVVPHRVLIAGSVPPGLNHAHRLAALPATRRITITISLALRRQSLLNQVLHDLYNPTSSSYHHFLTAGQFAHQFAPDAASRATVVSWLESQGIQVQGVSNNGLAITARGSAAVLEKAFATSLYSYSTNGHTFFANSHALQLPGNLAPSIVSVSGLSTTAQPRASSVHTVGKKLVLPGLSPSDLQHTYNVSSLAAQGFTGSGQTIAIATFGDYSSSDLTTFNQQFGLPAGTVTTVRVDGGASLGSRNGQDETEADIEIVHGMAPAAHVLVYEAPNSDTSAQTMIDLYTRIVGDNRASIVTSSWGSAESQYPASDIAALDHLFQEGAAQGQAFFAASGDAGAYDNAGNGPGGDTTLAVDFPASDPWVTGVGGTSLLSGASGYAGETVWSDASNPRDLKGSGGGLSAVFSQPAYQAGPGVANEYSNGKRQVPDVAADADPATGYQVFTVDTQDRSGWHVMGGTSGAAPLWAGFVAVANQAVGQRLGFLNPTLYALGQKTSTLATTPFHDITQGTNLYFPATTGWDYATGWGSFDGTAFVADVKALLGTTSGTLPTPTVTATPVTASPSISLQKVVLLHRVNGMLKVTNALKVGEQGTIEILYASRNAGSRQVIGSVMLKQNGHTFQTVTLKKTTYQGKPALTATVRVTSTRWVGTLLAHVTVRLGAIASELNHQFRLARG